MGPATVRRPLLVYALVFSIALAFALATVASFALLSLAQDASDIARTAELEALVAGRSAEEVRRAVASRTIPGIAVVTASVSAHGVDIHRARSLAASKGAIRPASGVSVARVDQVEGTLFVVAPNDPSPYLVHVRDKIRFVLFSSMIAALITGVLLSLMIARLVLPPLSALLDVAADVELDPVELSSDETPNEIAEVATTFRRTMRKLRQEREAIAAQHEELERMQASLIRASKLATVGRLAAGIAHEIGNPLAAVRGYLSLLHSGLDEVAERDVLTRSSTELNRIHETIQKLLTYARKDDSEGVTTPIVTSAIIADAIGLVQGHPKLRGVEIVQRLDAADGPDAIGQAGPLGQVLVNLLLNAAQAMEGVADPQLIVSTRRTQTGVEVTVEDDGPGVPAERFEQIFDPFYTTKPPGEGTGLGLAVSRALIERMDGDLAVSNRDAGGARFTISLPPAGPPAEPPA